MPVPAWAVIIGINQYVDEFTHPPLRCCVDDAIGLYLVLADPARGNLQRERVTLLLDGTDGEIREAAQRVVRGLEQRQHLSLPAGMVDVIMRERQPPERERILHTVHRAAANATREDLLLVQFSGHGYVCGGQMYLVTPRAQHPLYAETAISLRFVQQKLRDSKARHKLLLLDACYSGPSATQNIERAFSTAEEIAIFASCLPSEQCFEDCNLQHGIFTNFLLEGLSGKVDFGREYITLEDLYLYVSEQVKLWMAVHIKDGPLQTPWLNVWGTKHGSEIVLSGPRPILRPRVNRAPGHWWIAAMLCITVFLAAAIWWRWPATVLTAQHVPAQPPALAKEATIPAPQKQDSKLASVELQLAVMKRQGEVVSVLKSGDALKSGDYYGFFFKPSRRAYVYIVQQDSRGNIDVLFPNAKWTAQSNPVAADTTVWTPTDPQHWFFLDRTTGKEMLFVVASRAKVPILESVVEHQAIKNWIAAPERGVGGVKEVRETLSLPSGTKAGLAMTMTVIQGSGVDFVYKLEFMHK